MQYIKEDTPYYVGVIQDYWNSHTKEEGYKFFYEICKDGQAIRILVKETYPFLHNNYINRVNTKNNINKKHDDLVKKEIQAINELVEKGCSLQDIERAFKIYRSRSAWRMTNYKMVDEMLSDKHILERHWTDYLIVNYSHNKSQAPEIARRIGRVFGPSFSRKPENKKRNTFDYIHFDVSICGNDIDKKKYCGEHFKEIIDYLTNKLSITKSFIKYGVPINFLRVTDAIFISTDLLHICFELKDIPDNEDSQKNQAS